MHSSYITRQWTSVRTDLKGKRETSKNFQRTRKSHTTQHELPTIYFRYDNNTRDNIARDTYNARNTAFYTSKDSETVVGSGLGYPERCRSISTTRETGHDWSRRTMAWMYKELLEKARGIASKAAHIFAKFTKKNSFTSLNLLDNFLSSQCYVFIIVTTKTTGRLIHDWFKDANKSLSLAKDKRSFQHILTLIISQNSTKV